MKITASVIAAVLAASGIYWAVTTGTSSEQAYSGPLLEAAPTTSVAAPASTDRDGRDPWTDPLSYSGTPTAPAPSSSVAATVQPEPIAESVASAPEPVRESLRFDTYTPEPQATFTPQPRYSAESDVQPIGVDGQILQTCLDAVGIDPYGDNAGLIDEVGQEAFDDLLGTCMFGSITQG